MQVKETIGIDVSKLTMDVCIHSNGRTQKFENNPKEIRKMIKWAFKDSQCSREQTLFIFEQTGLYSHQLEVVLCEAGLCYVAESGLRIKRSLGISRGKDDKADAQKIALYGFRLREELKPSNLPAIELQSVKRLLGLRDRFVAQRAGFKASLKESESVLKKRENKVFFQEQEREILALSKRIKRIEESVDQIVAKNEELQQQYELIQTIEGVGRQTALFMMVYTEGFTKFETWRKFASYCGIAPFPNSSGTSLRGRTKVSNLANKRLKSLLHICALSSLQFNTEMKQFYDRRVEQGKNKMSTINIIRNKLLSRIFAVVKRATPYVDVLKYVS